MKFNKYDEIENTYRKKFVDYVIHEGLTEGEFVVQEKAHGANLSFWYDGTTLKSAKRSEFLNGEDFYNYKPVEEKHRDRVIKLYQLLKDKGYEFSVLCVYGELIGGTYPHKDVPKDKTATKVQKGIFYSPHNEFYAIDVVVDGKLLDVDTFNEVMEATGFLYAKTLFRGSFEECLKYPVNFPSQIPIWLGLPEIPNNICEGVVIKPVIPKFLSNNQRVILKNKNEKWQEKDQKIKVPKSQPALSKTGIHLLNELYSLITVSRLRNVLSKLGKISQNQFGDLLREYSKDILNEFNKDHQEAFQALEKHEQKQITTKLNQECSALIRLHFKNIVDGTF